jgi:hypothetical protein
MRLRDLPSVDELARTSGDPLAVDASRAVLARAREHIRAGEDPGDLREQLGLELRHAHAPRLRRVLNATGVIVHTNLGRAPLAPAALERVAEAARGYSNLEYDVAAGARGSRQSHVGELLARLTGAEAALVVNNNAAAVMLALAALAGGREVIVSRGELIEIGDGFRIPDVLSQSGATLREVGTTNRTRAADYERAIGPETAVLLRVHQSNFRVVGFTELPRLEELSTVARRHELVLVDDLGAEGVVDVVVDVGDPIGEPDDLRLGCGGLRHRPGVVHDAVANLPRQVQAAPVVLEIIDDTKALLVVPERAIEHRGERLLAEVPERRVAEVVAERDRLGEVLVEAERASRCSRDLRDLQRVGQPDPVVVALRGDEDLRLVAETPERLRVDDPVAVALEARPEWVELFGPLAALARGRQRGVRRKRLALDALDPFAGRGGRHGGHAIAGYGHYRWNSL